MELARTLISTDGTPLAYWLQRAGQGARGALVLLHGAASNHTRWSEFVAHTRLADSWHILRPDLRGSGASMTRGPQGIGIWCQDLEQMMAAEGLSSAVFIGHSLGAQIAVHMAHGAPTAVDGLVLIDPVFQRALKGRQLQVRRYRWLLQTLVVLVRVANGLGVHRRTIEPCDLRQLDRETRRALSKADSFDEIARKYSALGPIFRHTPVANYLRQALATVAPLPDLAGIGAPALVLLSGGTTLASLDRNKAEAARLANAQIQVLNANHWPLTESPDAVREAIEHWLLQFRAGPDPDAVDPAPDQPASTR